MVMGACGNSKTESDESPPGITPDITTDEVLSTGFIEVNEGGRVDCKVSDGATVSLEIPPKALNQSMDVKLGVELAEDSDVLYRIKIYPTGLQLYESATLIVEYPESTDKISDIGLFALTEDTGPVPLKQNQSKRFAQGGLYTFGEFVCSRFDMDRSRDISTKLCNAKTPVTWQSLLTVFNGIVWVGTYFYKNEEVEDALACFEVIPSLCGDGLEFFIEQAVPEDEAALEMYKKALEKYKYIQKLSSDQEVLLIDLDGK